MRMLMPAFLAGFLLTGCAGSPHVSEAIPWQQVKVDIPTDKALTSKAGPREIVFINVEVSFSGGPKLTSVESGLGERLVKHTRKTEALR